MRFDSDFNGGVRGRYASRLQEGSNVVVAPDVAAEFPALSVTSRYLIRVRVKHVRRRSRFAAGRAAVSGF